MSACITVSLACSHPTIALSEDVWQFLRPGSESYYHYSHNPLEQLFNNNNLPSSSSSFQQLPAHSDSTTLPYSSSSAAHTSSAVSAVASRHMRQASGASDDFVFVRQGNASAGGAAGAAAVGTGAVTSAESVALPVVGSPATGAMWAGGGLEKHEGSSQQQAVPGVDRCARVSQQIGSASTAHGASSAAIAAVAAAVGIQGRFSSAACTPPQSLSTSPYDTSDGGSDSGGGGSSAAVLPSHQGQRAASASTSSFTPHSTLEEQHTQYAEALGASDPLLDVVDTVFQLQDKGFLLRQVSHASRLWVWFAGLAVS